MPIEHSRCKAHKLGRVSLRLLHGGDHSGKKGLHIAVGWSAVDHISDIVVMDCSRMTGGASQSQPGPAVAFVAHESDWQAIRIERSRRLGQVAVAEHVLVVVKWRRRID